MRKWVFNRNHVLVLAMKIGDYLQNIFHKLGMFVFIEVPLFVFAFRAFSSF